MYRFYEEQVEEPRKLEDEIKDALAGHKAEVQSIEPARQMACALSYSARKLILIRNFNQVKTYMTSALVGVEVFIDNKVLARVVRSVQNRLNQDKYMMFDTVSPNVTHVRIRFVLDDPSHPDYEIVLWDPNDRGTGRAEGPMAAMETARRWFYHIEAILRREDNESSLIALSGLPQPTAPSPTPPQAPKVAPPATAETPMSVPAKANSQEGDILNAPLIPYL